MTITIALILTMLFIVLYVSLIEIYTILFRTTGLTNEKARFQVISLLTNAGFTTSESEIITSSPLRRKYAVATMITGHIFSAVIVSLVVSMAMTIQTARELTEHLALIIVAFVVFLTLIILIKVPAVNRPISQLLENLAQKRLAKRGTGNIITELDNYGKSSVVEIIVHDLPNMLVDVPLSRTYLKIDFDINILMVRRRGKALDVTADTIIQKEDTILAFGNIQNIKDIFINSRKKNVKEDDVLEKKKDNLINEIQIIDNYGRDAMVEVHVNTVPSFMVNKTIYQSNLKTNYDLNIMILKRNGVPQEVSRDTIIRKGDVVVIFGKYQTIKDIFLKMV